MVLGRFAVVRTDDVHVDLTAAEAGIVVRIYPAIVFVPSSNIDEMAVAARSAPAPGAESIAGAHVALMS